MDVGIKIWQCDATNITRVLTPKVTTPSDLVDWRTHCLDGNPRVGSFRDLGSWPSRTTLLEHPIVLTFNLPAHPLQRDAPRYC